MLSAAPLPEALDQLFLLPERALGMDSAQLRQDLAGLDFSNVQLLHTAPQGNVWLSGAAPVDASQRQGARSSAARDANTLGPDSLGMEDADGRAADIYRDTSGRDNGGLSQKEREDRLRALKERQNEERQKKLEELKQQALAAQKFREQKEEERRRRMDELRQRDNDRRHQVEERKRQIWEAERDRREAILRKNQEREARIDTKRKNERSSIVFAFGSSTPRMLEPADTGGSFWGTRRATSTTNVMMFTAAPLTRRASERELDGSKKRATSASGLDRKPGEGEEVDAPSSGAAYNASARVNRRKTDLMPTIPSPRDLTPTSVSSRPSSAHLQQQNRPFSRSPGLRSGEATPSPPSRPLSALSQQSMSSVNSGVNLRPRPLSAPRRQRPISIAVTGVSQEPSESHAARTTHRHSIAGELRATKAQSSSVDREGAKPPLPKVHSAKKTSKPETPAKKPTDKVLKSAKASPRVTPKATPLQSPGSEAPPTLLQDQAEGDVEMKTEDKQPVQEVVKVEGSLAPEVEPETVEETVTTAPDRAEESVPEVIESTVEAAPKQDVVQEMPAEPTAVPEKEEKPQTAQVSELEPEVDMTASMIAKIRITTEEEAKAALAERRRLAREQAEREAELERQRQEEERRREEERLRLEEEEQRQFEEEQLRLVEEARQAEEERLLQAIQENEKREEEEKKRKEEEARLKVEKEEADRKARDEAERLRREMDERLKKEEEERIARRKRVEAIMLRTRGKGATPTGTPTKGQQDGDGDIDEGKDESPSEESKSTPGEGNDQGNGEAMQPPLAPTNASDYGADQPVVDTLIGQPQENGQGKMSSSPPRLNSDLLLIDNSNVKPMELSEDLMISSATNDVLPPPVSQSNGHRNGMEYSPVDFVNVDNVKQYNNTTNNLLDLSEFDMFSGNNMMLNASQQPVTETTGEFEQILDLNTAPTTGKLANEDNVNSNVTTNGPTAPIIAFQDNLSKKQDTSVTDLLS